MARQVVTVYIDDTALQVLITRGSKVSKWARVPLEPGMVRGAMIVNEVEVARILNAAFRSQKIKTKKVVVGLSGLHSLSRPMAFPATSKFKLGETVIREAKKVLPVPLEQLYLSWRTGKVQDKKVPAFVVAVPRRIVDAMIGTMTRAGLKPRLFDIKPLALARLVSGPAIIVDVQPAECDIIVIAGGVPQPVRTVPLDDGPVAGKFKTISDNVQRTLEFYNASNGGNTLDPAAPLYVAGDLALEPQLAQSLAEQVGHPLSFLASPLSWRQLPDAGPYLVNIGLALKESKRWATASPNVNALPEAYREKPPSLLRAVAMPLTAGIAALLVPVAIVLQGATANIESMRSQLAGANRLIVQRQVEEQKLKKDVAALEKRAATAEGAYGGMVAAIRTMRVASNTLNGNFIALMENLYKDVRITNINYGKGTISVKGRLPREEDVLQYARKLEATDRFAEVIIASLTRVDDKGSGDRVEFTFLLKERP
ncbi:MAG: pilus assembly protein PilM [Chloroflexi bacterium]|nr:pilus assembly protein PilM [Chloroflexota bacterium]